MKYGLHDETIAAIQGVFLKYPAVEKVVLYGSRAKGNFKHGSDIDLTILEQGMSHADLLRLENELDDLMLSYKLDVSLYRELQNSALVEHIQRVGVMFYSRM